LSNVEREPQPLWEMPTPYPGSVSEALRALPANTRRVIEAVQAGQAGKLFPPVLIDGPERTLAVGRYLGGEADARALAHALAADRFTPLHALFDDIDMWCRVSTRRHADVFAHGVLDITNTDLFSPLVSEAFVACAAGKPHHARRFVPDCIRRYRAFLDLFLDRLRRDLPLWSQETRYQLPVVGLWANGEETHNGRQRVVRLDLAGGGRIAYKPRPSSGDVLLAARSRTDQATSLFELLNRLPVASGKIRLPVLSCWPGQDKGPRGYLWQEWVEPPTQWGTIRESGSWRLVGARLEPDEARQYWNQVGSLTAVVYAFGVTDLFGSNLMIGRTAEAPEPQLYPIDLEIYFSPVDRLQQTGLIFDPSKPDPNPHHVGLENNPSWCGAEGFPVHWEESGDGTLRLFRRECALMREQTRVVVADTQGHCGYGAYLPAMLRGMFDAWTVACRNRSAITGFLDRTRSGNYVRLLRKPTFQYFDALVSRWLSGGGAVPVSGDDAVRFDRAELLQMRDMDVPYFFRSLDGGPVLRVAPDGAGTARVVAKPEPDGGWPPSASVLDGARLTLSGLGVALRDAVEHVFDEVAAEVIVDEALGVRLHLQSPTHGQVSFDWKETGKRITYWWDTSMVRLRIDALDAPHQAPDLTRAGQIRRRLLRLDRLDGAIRVPWSAGGMTDQALESRLNTITEAGITWLTEIVRDHGWPGRTMVGVPAAVAASRLVQHATGHLEFRRQCLELMREAAEAGELPWRQVAYLIDKLRLAENRPQLYGTQLERVDGMLVPSTIEGEADIDQRRAELGMEPLAQYLEVARQRFFPVEAEAS
jgi:hypothetical protein